jgi:hypothetical protein
MKKKHDRILLSGLIKFDEHNNAYTVPFDWSKTEKRTDEEICLMQEMCTDVSLYIDKKTPSMLFLAGGTGQPKRR